MGAGGMFTGWIDLTRQTVCSHSTVVWASEAYSYDSARHRRTRWRSTVTGRCTGCGKPFAKTYPRGPEVSAEDLATHIDSGLTVDVDIALSHAVDVLTERLQRAADEGQGDHAELLALAKRVREIHARLQGARVVREVA